MARTIIIPITSFHQKPWLCVRLKTPQSLLFLFLATGLLLPQSLAASDPPASAHRVAVKARLAARSLLLDAAPAGRRIIAVGERGHILLSDDDGNTWQQVEVPTQATLTAVTFPTANHGWAVGHDLTILHTNDGGEHWTLQYEAPEKQSPLLDVWFRDTLVGYAVGAYGAFLATINGGKSWAAKQVSDEDFHFNSITATPAGKLFMAGEAGAVYGSDDGGVTWTKLTSPYGGSYFGILAPDEDQLLIFGLMGKLFRSDDGGTTWAPVATGTEASLMGGQTLPDGRVVIVGLGGTILTSHDYGRTFTLYTHPDRQAFATLLPAGNGALILFGEFGVTHVTPSAKPGDSPLAASVNESSPRINAKKRE